jgi:hypothetical protein
MLRRILSHFRGHSVGYVALFVALGGSAYAAAGGNMPFVRGSGAITTGRVAIDPTPWDPQTGAGDLPVPVAIADSPALFRVEATACAAGSPDGSALQSTSAQLKNTSAAHVDVWEDSSVQGDSTRHDLAPGEVASIGGTTTAGVWRLVVSTPAAGGTPLATTTITAAVSGGKCHWVAQIVRSD